MTPTLQHRQVRLEQVLRALRGRAVERSYRGDLPSPLRQAIAGFSAELDAVRARLREDARSRTAAAIAPRPREEEPACPSSRAGTSPSASAKTRTAPEPTRS